MGERELVWAPDGRPEAEAKEAAEEEDTTDWMVGLLEETFLTEVKADMNRMLLPRASAIQQDIKVRNPL